jgi:hypothetical protein
MKYVFLASLFMIGSPDAYSGFNKAQQNGMDRDPEAICATVRILFEQPESIETWKSDRVYLIPGRIVVSADGVYVCARNSRVKIPSFNFDDQGVFIFCSKEEAQKHYDRAWEALRDAVGHSMGAGAAIIAEQPLIGVYEGYRAVEKYKEFGREYSQGMESEGRGTMNGPSDSKD